MKAREEKDVVEDYEVENPERMPKVEWNLTKKNDASTRKISQEILSAPTKIDKFEKQTNLTRRASLTKPKRKGSITNSIYKTNTSSRASLSQKQMRTVQKKPKVQDAKSGKEFEKKQSRKLAFKPSIANSISDKHDKSKEQALMNLKNPFSKKKAKKDGSKKKAKLVVTPKSGLVQSRLSQPGQVREHKVKTEK